MNGVRTWLILGASSAIGRALAREAAARGHDVVLAGRDMADLDRTAADIRISTGRNAKSVAFNAEDLTGHEEFVRQMAALGVRDIALLFAVMPDQAAMEASPSLAGRCMLTNFVAATTLLLQFAAILEPQREGSMMVFGSVAGDRGRLKNHIYGATKAGLHTFLSGLRNRLGRSNIHVMTVKPGFMDTAMTWGLPGLFLLASPQSVARHCLDAIQARRNVIYVPAIWRFIMLIIAHIPEAIFKKLSF